MPYISSFKRLTELEDALSARTDEDTAIVHTCMVQSLVIIGMLHARLMANALDSERLDISLTEIAERLVLITRLSPAFDSKQISAMLAAFQDDIHDERR